MLDCEGAGREVLVETRLLPALPQLDELVLRLLDRALVKVVELTLVAVEVVEEKVASRDFGVIEGLEVESPDSF